MTDEVSAAVKAHATGRWAEIMFRALSRSVAQRWQFVSFRGKGKGEYKGVVDVLAIRKDTSEPRNKKLKRADLFEVILVQIKGGSAPSPTEDDCVRLREVARHYDARSIVLFEWKKGVSWRFLVLDQKTLRWNEMSGEQIFA